MKFTQPNEQPSEQVRERYSVLVVDDDAALLETTVAVLEEQHKVVGTCFPREALRMARSGEYQVIVTDWMMPRMTGLELYRAVCQLDLGIACILMTGRMEEFAEENSREERKLLGLISKPFLPAQLLARVNQLGRLATMKMSVKRLRSGE